MNKNLKKILIYSIANDTIKTFTTIFLNLYLWSNGQSIVTIAILNISMYATWSIIFPLSANLVNKRGIKFVYRMSAIGNVILFVSILILPKENFELWVILIGIAAGLPRSIYSSAKNISISMMAKEDGEIAKFYRYDVLFLRMAQIVTPIILALLIHYMDYKASFIFMLIYSVGLYLLVETIPDIKKSKKEGNVLKNILSPFKNKEKKFKMLPFSYLMGGMFAEFQVIFLAVFTFTITENQLGVAILNVAYSLMIMLLIKLNNRYSKIKGYVWLYIGATLGFLGFGFMYFENQYMLIISNFLLVAGTFYYSTTYYSQQLEIIRGLQEVERMKMIVIREVGLIISRMMFLIPIIIFSLANREDMLYLLMFVMIMTFSVPQIHKKMTKK